MFYILSTHREELLLILLDGSCNLTESVFASLPPTVMGSQADQNTEALSGVKLFQAIAVVFAGPLLCKVSLQVMKWQTSV